MTISFAQETCARTSLVLAAEDHADLEAPMCTRHWRAAVGVVTWETSDDHERREPFCATCAWDVMSTALLCQPFVPPVVSVLDLDLHREWSVAS